MEVKLRCTVNPGQFSSEYALTVQSFNGKILSLFAARSQVECEITPTPDQSSEGWVTVQIVNRSATHYLVMLPQSTLENGRYISVNADQLKGIANDRLAETTG
jgi:hypothetical protein